jgi:hypothetical protein
MDWNDPSTIDEWLYLEPDGELTSTELKQLDAVVAASPELARTRRELARLSVILDTSKIEVRPSFKSEVLASLPPAAWSARQPRNWWVAVAVLAMLGGVAALLAGLSAAQLQPASPFLAAMAAVGDLLASSVAAGAGLAGASWRGIGLAVGDWLGESIPNAVALGVLVVGLNLLVLRRLRRRVRPQVAASESKPGSVQ